MTTTEGITVGTYKTRDAAERDAAKMMEDWPEGAPAMVLYINDDATWTLVDVAPDSFFA